MIYDLHGDKKQLLLYNMIKNKITNNLMVYENITASG